MITIWAEQYSSAVFIVGISCLIVIVAFSIFELVIVINQIIHQVNTPYGEGSSLEGLVSFGFAMGFLSYSGFGIGMMASFIVYYKRLKEMNQLSQYQAIIYQGQ